jgi:hypothetical protein
MIVFGIDNDEAAVVLTDLIRVLNGRTDDVIKLLELFESMYLR